MSECIFCKIIGKEIPGKVVYEDDKYLAFEDINPKAPIHLLIIPKKHIESVNNLKSNELNIMADITSIAQKLSKDLDLSGYRLITNSGKSAGQIVFHLHIHFMGWKESLK